MSILVTGATGNVGSEVVKQLSAQGIPVRAMVHDTAKATKIAGSNVEIVAGDFGDVASIEAAMTGIDHVFLLPPMGADTVERQADFIDAAKRLGVKHLVKLSAMRATEDSPVTLLKRHWDAEQILAASGVPYTILQPNAFSQNLLGSAPTIAGQGMLFLPAAEAQISHVDVRDIAAVAVKTLTEPGHVGKTYVLTGPSAVTYGEVAAILTRVLDKQVTYVPITPEQFKQAVMGFGMAEWMVDGLNGLYELYRNGQGALVTDDIAQVTGTPARSYEQFVSDYAPAFRGQ